MIAPPESGATPPHLELRGVTVSRDGRALVRDLDLAIPRGRFLAVVGPSGVGKTSLLAGLAGLLDPTAGDIIYRDEQARPHAPREYRRHLGLVFQHLRLTPNATVRTNVLCGLLGQRPWWRTLLGFPRHERPRAGEILARFELDGYDAAPVARLSGGERQRVAIARALLAEPAFILADEPVSSLDDRLARHVLGELRRETRAPGRTVVCVLHHETYVREYADLTLTLDRDDPAAWTLTPTNP